MLDLATPIYRFLREFAYILPVPTVTMTISELLQDAKDRKGISDQSIAEFVGVSKTSINRWRRGHSTPDPAYCRLIAKYLNLDEDEVLRMAGHKSDGDQEAAPLPQLVREVMAVMMEMDDSGQRMLLESAEMLRKHHPRR